MTLIETMIAMLLASLILTTLMFFYQHVTRVDKEMDSLQKEHFEKLYVENRLGQILPKSIINHKKKSACFFTEVGTGAVYKNGTTSLIFTFDNGAKLNPKFSSIVLGRLYVNQEKQLMLAIWPSPSRWSLDEPPPIHQELLMNGVEDLSFSFFIPKATSELPRSKKDTNALKPLPEGTWANEWLKEYQKLPPMLRLELKLSKKKEHRVIKYAFFLPHTKYHIAYDE